MINLTAHSIDALNILVFGAEPDVATAAMDELRTRAGRESIARSMATDDLQDMLPDFEQVAAVCGIRPEQAQINKTIVIDELRRRGVEA